MVPPHRVNLPTVKKPAAATSPDCAAGKNLADTVPSISRSKRGRGGGNETTGDRRRVAPKVARLSGVEETNTQSAEEAVTPTLTEKCVKLILDLWSDDRNVIQKSLTDLADEDDGQDEIVQLGGHMAIVQVLKKNLEDVLIQEEGIEALGNFGYATLGKVLVGDIGGVEVILTGMRQHPVKL
jgi:hypothetical protein